MLPSDVLSFSSLYSGWQIAVYVGVSVLAAVLLFYSSMKFLLVMQQCGYKGKRYFKWLSAGETPYLSRLMLLCLLGFLFFCVLNVCFMPVFKAFMGKGGSAAASYLGFISFFLFTIVYINSESAVNAKVPLKKTKRIVRLSLTYLVLLGALVFGLITLFNYLAYIIGDEVVSLLRFSLICGTPILTPYVLFLAYGINEPFEHIIKKRYIRVAKEKLEKSAVLKIGITGSFAKTSVKEILKTVLSQKFRVLATPDSYNTPAGIALSVKKLDNTYDVFIAEMGARSCGDIKELAKIVRPKFGVLTGINSQHLETFLTEENIKNTKYELFENLTEGGIGFFSADGEKSVELFNRFGGEKYQAGISADGSFAYASDIEVGASGTTFTLNICGEKPVKCTTVLLGKHSISNIALAASVAYKAGMTAEEIALGIGRLKSVGHRLEIVRNNKGIIIIDDSYNSNETGVLAAMEVLDIFKGRKIVITPGLVELGKEENVANARFGKILASHADVVIIVGKHNAEMLINGLLEGGKSKDGIIFAKNLKRGNEELNSIIQAGDVVLFENDLPDNYN